MTSAAKSPYAGYRFPGEVISHAVWLYFRFPLSLRMVEEMLAARGIDVSHETVRQWARKFGDRAPVGAQVRPGLRQPDPASAARPRRQVAPRRCVTNTSPEERRCGAVREMRVGPSRSAVRCRPQTPASCGRQERSW